jgi:subtilase family serine protease
VKWSGPAAIAIAGLVLAGSLVIAPTHVGAIGVRGTPPGVMNDIAPIPPGRVSSPLPPATPISITLTLTGADPGGLAKFLSSVESPSSVAYRHYLTAPEFESMFSPSTATVDRVAAELRSVGARDLSIPSDRLTVTAVLATSEVEALFGVSLVTVGSYLGAAEYTATGSPSLPSGLAGLVTGIGGLSNLAASHLTRNFALASTDRTLRRAGPPDYLTGNTSGAQWFIGSDYTQILGASHLFPGSGTPNATYPTHVAIATLLASGYNESTGTNLPPWDPTAIGWYLNSTLGPGWPSSNVTGVPVPYDGVTPPLPGPTSSLGDDTLDQIENSLDLEMAGSLAPGAPVYNFYLAGSLLASLPTGNDIADAFATALSDALTQSYGSARLGVVSASFGLPDLNDSAWNSALAMAAAMGVTVVVASGDQANAPNSLTGRDAGPWPTWPASATFNTSGAIAVGGVTVNVTGRPAGWYNSSGFVIQFDSNITGIQRLSTWYDTHLPGGIVAGSEGGMSTQFPEPYWQFHSAAQPPIVNATVAQGLTTLQRAEPDLAFPANFTIIADAANSTGAVFGSVLAGTSIAAPAFAGFLADEIAVRSGNAIGSSWSPFGFLDPTIYRAESFYAAHPAVAGNPIVDVTQGSNYFFSAGPGWDPTTGWGVPMALPFLTAMANGTITDYAYSGPTPGLPAHSSPAYPWVEIYVIFGVGLTVAVVLVIVTARRPSRTPPTVPWGAQTGGPPAAVPGHPYGGATFLCPYCGAVRPAEPIRCPNCGAL